MIFLQLLFAFFQIGAFSIGGGYAALPLIQDQVVEIYKWLNLKEFTDLITISQMTPGPIAINTASFVGMRVAGIPGALAATFGCVLPSAVIVLIIAYFYKKYNNLKFIQGTMWGLHPAVIGLIAATGYSMLVNTIFGENGISFNFDSINFIAVALVVLCLIAVRKTKINPAFIMLGAGALGGLIYSFI